HVLQQGAVAARPASFGYPAGKVHKFYLGVNGAAGPMDLGQLVQPPVGHATGREGCTVDGSGRGVAGEQLKQSRLAAGRKAQQSNAHRKTSSETPFLILAAEGRGRKGYRSGRHPCGAVCPAEGMGLRRGRERERPATAL